MVSLSTEKVAQCTALFRSYDASGEEHDPKQRQSPEQGDGIAQGARQVVGQGGGADRLARLIRSIIEKNDFSNQPFIPINKGGGSGAEALRYLKDKAGDPHVIMATLNSLYHTLFIVRLFCATLLVV